MVDHTKPLRHLTALLVAVVVTLLGGTGQAATAAATPATSPLTVAAECGDTTGFRVVPLADLPAEAGETYRLIQRGGPFPYPEKDGSVFANRERLLPLCETGYYREYTVPTPGSPDRGARRIVTGSGGEHFYTADHYRSFVLIRG
ncbi:ribonuclease domain-containing protein [Amycolatopsis arida]|nr:ribonuclease domain-containing protein [Amycolatopsis arida]